MRGAVVEGGVAAVEIKVGIEVVGYFQAGLLQASKCAARGQQLGFQGAPASFGLRVVIRVARPGIAGQRPSFFDALPASVAGVLAAPVSVTNKSGSWLA